MIDGQLEHLSRSRLKAAKVGDRLHITGVYHTMTVKARNNNFVVCNRIRKGCVTNVVIFVEDMTRTSLPLAGIKLSEEQDYEKLINSLERSVHSVELKIHLKYCGLVPAEVTKLDH